MPIYPALRGWGDADALDVPDIWVALPGTLGEDPPDLLDHLFLSLGLLLCLLRLGYILGLDWRQTGVPLLPCPLCAHPTQAHIPSRG